MPTDHIQTEIDDTKTEEAKLNSGLALDMLLRLRGICTALSEADLDWPSTLIPKMVGVGLDEVITVTEACVKNLSDDDNPVMSGSSPSKVRAVY